MSNVKHFLNLTNGLEFLPQLEGKQLNFLRIQSTACEQHQYDRIIMDLDNNFLMWLALGYTCLVYDCGAHKDTPRAMSQGLQFVRYCCERVWFDREGAHRPGVLEDFRQYYQKLSNVSRNKLKYYRKFLNTQTVALGWMGYQTTHDGDYSYYRRSVIGALGK